MVPSPAELRPTFAQTWPWLFWAVWGAWIAFADLRQTDLQPAMVRLLFGAMVLGYARPRRWWLWALVLALWVPLEPVLGVLFGLAPTYDYNPGMWLLPPLPALAGALVGRGLASAMRGSRS
jgi:hypothetical protein